MKLAFVPVSLVAGLLAGLLSKKLFDFIWSRFDEEEAPHPKHREIDFPKLVAALVVEGAVFRLVKGLVDHGARRSFERATGEWPGEEAPESA
ncbi:MAG TPA: DUF4235 domain-containing protein [Thermoleophilaceae bacterium]|jgi:hypothetical protein|nr:DUF4235 domain-containing protein [Thermoleophilaceae bacterium]